MRRGKSTANVTRGTGARGYDRMFQRDTLARCIVIDGKRESERERGGRQSGCRDSTQTRSPQLAIPFSTMSSVTRYIVVSVDEILIGNYHGVIFVR